MNQFKVIAELECYIYCVKAGHSSASSLKHVSVIEDSRGRKLLRFQTAHGPIMYGSYIYDEPNAVDKDEDNFCLYDGKYAKEIILGIDAKAIFNWARPYMLSTSL